MQYSAHVTRASPAASTRLTVDAPPSLLRRPPQRRYLVGTPPPFAGQQTAARSYTRPHLLVTPLTRSSSTRRPCPLSDPSPSCRAQSQSIPSSSTSIAEISQPSSEFPDVTHHRVRSDPVSDPTRVVDVDWFDENPEARS